MAIPLGKILAASKDIEMSASAVPQTADPVTTDMQNMTIAASRPVDQGLSVPLRQHQNANIVDSIRAFLSKPRQVTNVTWSTASASASTLAYGRSFDLTADPFFAGKLQGFSGIRYTTNIKVLLNANPFQQGKLRLSYYPNARESQSKKTQHLADLTTMSQLPGVEFTTGDGGCEVSVPFLSFLEYYDMETGRGDPLMWYLSVFSPLVNGAGAAVTTASVSVWVWYTDVELFGATNVVPQSRKPMKRTKMRTVAAEEEPPLSNWLSASSRLAASMSDIPVISSIAGPSATWLKQASGLANSYGYSRPVNGEPVRPMAPHYHSSITNSDGINTSSTLAFNHDASARLISDFSPSGMDEMSLNFIKKQWAYVGEFSFPRTANQGDQLWRIPLTPRPFDTSVLFGRTYTPVAFLAQLMRQYRGGFELDFRFVKTGFHAGSLGISYLTSENPPNTITENDSDLLHRTIVDIQEGDSICLSFPFISRRTWLETYMNYGAAYVHVINSLVAPETVPANITVQVFMRGMDDLEFSGVADQNCFIPSIETPIIAPQGIVTDGAGEIVCAPVGGLLQEPPLDGLAMMDAVSESVTSLLQIAKMGARVQFPFAGTSDDTLTFSFNPSAYNCRGLQVPSTITEPAYICTAMSAIKACFAYQRGGYELNILPTSSSALNTYTVSQRQYYGTSNVFQLETRNVTGCRIDGTTSDRFHFTQPLACNHGRFGVSATLPYKSLHRVNVIYPTVTGTTYNSSQFRSVFLVTCKANDTLLLRGAEDFQLLYWVGVPPLGTF